MFMESNHNIAVWYVRFFFRFWFYWYMLLTAFDIKIIIDIQKRYLTRFYSIIQTDFPKHGFMFLLGTLSCFLFSGFFFSATLFLFIISLLFSLSTIAFPCLKGFHHIGTHCLHRSKRRPTKQ